MIKIQFEFSNVPTTNHLFYKIVRLVFLIHESTRLKFLVTFTYNHLHFHN